jgi:hypothetical protein
MSQPHPYALVAEHILTGEKRPEMKLIKVAMAAEGVLDEYEGFRGRYLEDDDTSVDMKAMAHLHVELDKLKVVKP